MLEDAGYSITNEMKDNILIAAGIIESKDNKRTNEATVPETTVTETTASQSDNSLDF